jgi:glycosyltransferase involved in cell wall biosynthesis
MRVLHVAEAASRNFGGVQTVMLELAKEQAARGIDTCVVSTNIDSPAGVIDAPTDAEFHRDGVAFRCFKTEFRPLLVSLAMKRFIDREIASFDVVHTHGLYRFPTSYTAMIARRRNLPYVMQTHGQLDPYLYSKSSRSVWLKRLYERAFELPNLNGAGAVIYTADEERDRAAFLGLKAPSRVIPNGLDWARFKALPKRGALRAKWGWDANEIVLFIGRLHHKKGLDLLVGAFDQLRCARPGARLLIAGPDATGYGQQVRAWADARGLADFVRFTGMLEGEDVPQAYVDADVFVLPSYSENFGMTVVEAMACQTPVVISDQVNIHAEISDAGCGVVVPCDETRIANALHDVLANKPGQKAMGVAGRRRARERFTWSSIVDQVIDQYDEVIQRQSRSTERNVIRM